MSFFSIVPVFFDLLQDPFWDYKTYRYKQLRKLCFFVMPVKGESAVFLLANTIDPIRNLFVTFSIIKHTQKNDNTFINYFFS